jgi:hypothetical protein
MSRGRRPSLEPCGAPTLYRIDPAAQGGYEIRVAHFCHGQPPCRQYTIWGPFETLDDAVSVRRITWPNALPGDPELFPIRTHDLG